MCLVAEPMSPHTFHLRNCHIAILLVRSPHPLIPKTQDAPPRTHTLPPGRTSPRSQAQYYPVLPHPMFSSLQLPPNPLRTEETCCALCRLL